MALAAEATVLVPGGQSGSRPLENAWKTAGWSDPGPGEMAGPEGLGPRVERLLTDEGLRVQHLAHSRGLLAAFLAAHSDACEVTVGELNGLYVAGLSQRLSEAYGRLREYQARLSDLRRENESLILASARARSELEQLRGQGEELLALREDRRRLEAELERLRRVRGYRRPFREPLLDCPQPRLQGAGLLETPAAGRVQFARLTPPASAPAAVQ